MAPRSVPAVHHEALETGLAAEGLPLTFVATVTFYLCRRMVWHRQREGHGPHPLQDPGAGLSLSGVEVRIIRWRSSTASGFLEASVRPRHCKLTDRLTSQVFGCRLA
jgi:hypothetical protein